MSACIAGELPAREVDEVQYRRLFCISDDQFHHYFAADLADSSTHVQVPRCTERTAFAGAGTSVASYDEPSQSAKSSRNCPGCVALSQLARRT
ncbi:hypothetical protein QRX50_31730 [Amycolatopsis carbonis]|uniref:Uncharacterized protein n=1 Tax=Amycolatopsis carbonis TaxID=715471 RepID=A0A9Y2MRZ2_9PSEU|nr:hypothetical protein [Amycolatopsis sp. 2-15]WIX76031.1 hypothetical protein QRX50_31730 [Amycolatopsis sp. 2-15]